MRFIKWVLLWIARLFSKQPGEVSVTKVPRKKHDTTKFTRQDYDVIMYEYNTYQSCKRALGKHFQSTLDDVTRNLNDKLGYDKSKNSYAPIWQGKITRESLGDNAGV